jgi:maltose O-acetyltransferase
METTKKQHNKKRVIRVVGLFWSWFVKTTTGWLPDIPIIMRMRGWLYGLWMPVRGRNFQVVGSVTIKGLENLHVGKHIYLSHGTILYCGAEIILEDQVLVGPFVVMVTGTHVKENGSYRFSFQEYEKIEVGFGSWLGSHVTVTAGSKIGKGCVVGANAVVTSDLPAHTFAAGLPARVIDDR